MLAQDMHTTQAQDAAAASLTDFRQYLEGQALYMRHMPLDACENAAQRRGWNDACRYEAEETPHSDWRWV